MLNLLTAFADFVPDPIADDQPVDLDFITNFLSPYFQNLPRAELAAQVAQVVLLDDEQRNRTRWRQAC